MEEERTTKTTKDTKNERDNPGCRHRPLARQGRWRLAVQLPSLVALALGSGWRRWARGGPSRFGPVPAVRVVSNEVCTLRNVLAVVEAYPELKASEHFLALQGELANTEDRIQAARRFYNGNGKDLNNVVQMFPSNLVASLFGFQPVEYFEIEDSRQREGVRTEF